MKVSIITVSFNSETTIKDTLESVQAQDYPEIEHIIVDGGSIDNTLGIVKKFPHVALVISERDNGIYDAMNKGIKAATGEIIGLLNSDDFYCSIDIIKKIVQKFNESGAQAVYGDLIYVDPKDKHKIIRYWRSGTFKPSKMRYGWMPPHPSFFVKKELYKRYGLFNIVFRISADYELMLRFLYKNKVSVAYISELVVAMRAGGASNASIKQRMIANKEDKLAWKINNLIPSVFLFLCKPIRKIPQFILRKRK